jgi:hypothetical protein
MFTILPTIEDADTTNRKTPRRARGTVTSLDQLSGIPVAEAGAPPRSATAAAEPLPRQNRAQTLTWCFTLGARAHSSHLLVRGPGVRLANAPGPGRRRKGHGDLGPPARGRGTATSGRPAKARLGRPLGACRPGQAAARTPAAAPDRDARTLRVPKTCAVWPNACWNVAGRWRLAGTRCPARWWDDLRLVGLKLIFLVVSRAVSVLGLSWRESWWKDAEILMLRHQLAIAERERPSACSRLTWPDRHGWPCSPGRCRPAGLRRCCSSSLPAPSCGGTATSSAGVGAAARGGAVPVARRRTARSGPRCCA